MRVPFGDLAVMLPKSRLGSNTSARRLCQAMSDLQAMLAVHAVHAKHAHLQCCLCWSAGA